MSVQRYVMRPVARDAIEFDGTYNSAVEIAQWIVADLRDDEFQLTTINEKANLIAPEVQSVMLTRNLPGMFGSQPHPVPILMWGFTNTGERPLTIHTEGGGTSAKAGYFVVKNPDGTFIAIAPDKFNETYRKQSN